MFRARRQSEAARALRGAGSQACSDVRGTALAFTVGVVAVFGWIAAAAGDYRSF
jgi:hypothetical protein